MNSSDRFSIQQTSIGAATRGIRLLLVLAAVSLCAAQTAQAQTSYSDMWLNGAPSSTNSADESLQPPVDELSSDSATLAGCGVTEDDYTSYYNYQSQARIISPSGLVAEATGTTGLWSRADVGLSMNLAAPEEGDYTIETVHTRFTSGPGGTQLLEQVDGHHSSRYRNKAMMAARAAAPPMGLFSWITRLIARVRSIKIVYKYQSTLAVPGTESLYYYSLVCQRPNCRADAVKSFKTDRFGGARPPYVIIRGVYVSVNLIVTRINFCGGRAYAAYYPETC